MQGVNTILNVFVHHPKLLPMVSRKRAYESHGADVSGCPFLSTGSSIGFFIAHDMDEANTVNSILKYKLVDQTPKIPSDGLFLIQEYEGKVQLGKRSLKKQDNPQYNLTVEVADRGESCPCVLSRQ